MSGNATGSLTGAADSGTEKNEHAALARTDSLANLDDWTQFQTLAAAGIASIGNGTAPGEDESYGLALKRIAETWLGNDVNHGRLYPNLDTLEERGIVESYPLDKRTNEYLLTAAGEQYLYDYTALLLRALGEGDLAADLSERSPEA